MALYPRIRSLREKANLTQDVLAKQIGVQKVKYVRYELGLRDPPVSFLSKLAIFYNISSNYILGLTDTPMPLK